jgi:hypothetical protein
MDATRHVCNQDSMFDDDDTTVRVVFASAIQHDIKPRRLMNVFFDPSAKVNTFAIKAAQRADPTFEVRWEDRTLYSNGVLVGKFSRRQRVFVEFGAPQRHRLRSWLVPGPENLRDSTMLCLG